MTLLSHPTGVRGLKPLPPRVAPRQEYVAPHRGAWIETDQPSCSVVVELMSHPTGVRGLKRCTKPQTLYSRGRTPQGCVD